MLNRLCNDYLIDSYIKANSLDLEPYFIFLIEQELSKRGLSSKQSHCSYSNSQVVNINADIFSDRNKTTYSYCTKIAQT
ncbi:sporulation histidine kinase inhibitor Sda [Cytobacillus oceanisediminis]|uniref:sporulation histidine kinase inhibitor Sda n=1 Tax=Cytobacillus oceanisediminis TaxID=665099 RepID=UPI00119D99BE|nr:sporulation histidine kinase inhibitor Sda [Cytobacillus oceanisediminis]MBZ9536691.1 sporulation histidine kinase inhibitor Sda [Cytobacillus oceanisediminis]